MGMCSALGMYAPEVQASNGEANSLIATSVQQTKKVTGNISDSMGPLIGATIKEKGTGNGAVTDLDGNFSINVKPGATLVISYVGYNTKEIVVGNQTNIKVSMEVPSLMAVVAHQTTSPLGWYAGTTLTC